MLLGTTATVQALRPNRGVEKQRVQITLRPETDEDEERWLWVACEGSRQGYRDMEAFIESLADPDRADRLWIAIQAPMRVPQIQRRARAHAR
jgi:hypothetical protein